jgi:hypothetical protein
MANITKEERARREAEAKVETPAVETPVETKPETTAEAELAAKYETGEILENIREPIEPVSDDAPKPVSDGASALPVGTPGHADVANPAVELTPEEEASLKAVPVIRVRLKHGWYPKDGSAKLEAGTEVELQQADGNHLIESGIAEYIVHFQKV